MQYHPQNSKHMNIYSFFIANKYSLTLKHKEWQFVLAYGPEVKGQEPGH